MTPTHPGSDTPVNSLAVILSASTSPPATPMASSRCWPRAASAEPTVTCSLHPDSSLAPGACLISSQNAPHSSMHGASTGAQHGPPSLRRRQPAWHPCFRVHRLPGRRPPQSTDHPIGQQWQPQARLQACVPCATSGRPDVHLETCARKLTSAVYTSKDLGTAHNPPQGAEGIKRSSDVTQNAERPEQPAVTSHRHYVTSHLHYVTSHLQHHLRKNS